ncbi:APC family permease [Pseudomonas capeferrum]|uniref:APC family permease n=1 Tax=Pseudomonas capeferrum TaxID=1495066 RepID=UPI0015E49147|nr:APC family permease [Pseudomonas capeferrum]MBA1200787.1 APC family permease [Pseudomonas capeferrum]
MAAHPTLPSGGTGRAPAPRKLGLTSLLAVAIGLVVSQGVMVLMLQGVGIAGFGFIIPLAIAWLLALCYACSFSELALMMPRSGGLSTYTEVAIGQFPAILATFSGYIVVAMFALSAELLLMEFIIDKVYPHSLPSLSIAFGVLALFTVLNLFNIDIFARLQTALAVVMVVILLVMGLGAIASDIPTPNPTALAQWNPMGMGVIALAAMAVWGFVGAEFVCPLVEETRRPERAIPASMFIGLTVIFVIICAYGLGALLTVPQAELAANGLPHYLFATTVFGETGKVFLVAASITATCSTLNSSLAAIPRMLFGMARNGQAFKVFKVQGKRSGAPWVAVLFISGVTGLPLLLMHDHPDAINQLLLSAALAWLLAYVITHINVIALRRRYPLAARPFKTPLYPLPQAVGIAGMLYAIWHVSPSPDMTFAIFAYAGMVLLLVSVIAIIWIKVVMRKPLFKPEPLALDEQSNRPDLPGVTVPGVPV